MIFRFALPALLALPLGFFGLALAAQNEPSIPVLLLVLFSPGLKLAELITPEHHASLGATFGWFLRIGIGVRGPHVVILRIIEQVVDQRIGVIVVHGAVGELEDLEAGQNRLAARPIDRDGVARIGDGGGSCLAELHRCGLAGQSEIEGI